MWPDSWSHDPPPVGDFVSMASREGLRPSSVEHGRYALIRYVQWLRAHGLPGIEKAGLKEFVQYRTYLLQQPISKATARNYLTYVVDYYIFKMQTGGGERYIELCERMQGMRRIWRGYPAGESYKPFSPETLRKILKAARGIKTIPVKFTLIPSEDYAFVMTLLFTGGRSQFYGLRVDEIDFVKMEIRTRVKGGKLKVLPLHPTLAKVLRRHLATRTYRSDHVFRGGRDPDTFQNMSYNRVRALRICKRVQAAAGLSESVHPHRFRVTFATMGRSMGMSLEHVQAILGHGSPLTTLGTYIRPDMAELRRDFASIDFAEIAQHGGPSSGRDTVGRKLQRAPPGGEHAWALIVRGLSELMEGRQ
jgi:integrase